MKPDIETLKLLQEHEKVDVLLDLKTEKTGGYSTQLEWKDRLRLRAIVKKVHMAYYPTEMITDLEADKMIDVIAPETRAYLIEKNWNRVK